MRLERLALYHPDDQEVRETIDRLRAQRQPQPGPSGEGLRSQRARTVAETVADAPAGFFEDRGDTVIAFVPPEGMRVSALRALEQMERNPEVRKRFSEALGAGKRTRLW